MTTISKEYQFAAGHQLWRDDWGEVENETIFGKCARKHGHNYTVTIEVSGAPDPNDGMVINYYELDTIAKKTFLTWDHYFLNDIIEASKEDSYSGEQIAVKFLPTAENLAQLIYSWILPDLLNQRYIQSFTVTVAETPKTTARYPS